MAAQLLILALCVAAVLGTRVPAAKYPAGVSPHACPNYPYCDNAALAAGQHGALAPYAAPAYAAYGHHGAAVHGAEAKYPAGVDPHTCPNYPYCGPTPVHRLYGFSHGIGAYGVAGYGWAGAHGAPTYGYGLFTPHHGAGARYPAGVDPHACPNYPYCH